MKKKNIAITAAAVTLAAALVLGGTYAYLTSETNSVKNTFDPNQNSVDINETTEGYDIIPGTSQDKNPTITATYTLDSYVFVEVTDATDDLVTWYIANGWTPLEDPTVNENEDDNVTTTNVYYQLLKYDDTEGETNTATLSVLAGNKVYYSASLTNSDMENADDDISLTFQGYIIQAEPFADAANAWLVVNGEGVAINDDTGVVYTDSVATAIDVAKEGETVRLLTNQTIEATQTYITTSMTLELDGHTLNAYHIMMQGDADLVLQNGTLNCTTGIAQDITNDEVYGTGDLTLTNVELTVSSGYAIQFNTGTITIDSTTSINHTGSNTYVIALFPEKTDDFITLNVYGTIKATGEGSSAIGANATSPGNTEINIYDGANITATDCAIYHPQRGVLNVYGGTISGYCGIITVGGTLNIYGGTIEGTADDLFYKSGYSRVYTNGAAILVFAGGSGYSENTVNISGGTIKSTYCYALWADSLSGATHTAIINISGGTFSGVTYNDSNINQDYSSETGEYAVSNYGVSSGKIIITDNRTTTTN